MKVKYNKFIEDINSLSEKYRFFGPVRHEKAGRYSDTDVLYYEVREDFRDFDFSEKSNFSAKEIVTPNNQNLFHFQDGQIIEAGYDTRPIIVFLRSCDFWAYKRLDNIYLNNKFADSYYKRLRELLNFAVIGCKTEFEDCFCVPFGTNKTDEYQIGINLIQDENAQIEVDVKDEKFKVFKTDVENNNNSFILDHVKENKNKVKLPKLTTLDKVKDLDIWEEYNTRCVGCGSCNFVCPTCSCFTTQDIAYNTEKTSGVRKRVLASCMTENFTTMAGGHSFREKNGEKMRFKLMHKVNDYNRRFGVDMCVGCGRCDKACPELISFSKQINKLTSVIGGRDE